MVRDMSSRTIVSIAVVEEPTQRHREDRPTSPPVISGRWSTRPLIILAAVIVVMYLAREVLIPLAFALVLSLIWTPPVNWLQKLHFRRAPAVLVVVVLSLGVAGDVGWIILNQLIAVVNELPNYQQNIRSKLTSLRSSGKGSLGQARKVSNGSARNWPQLRHQGQFQQ
jgi:predicted PurR-regulated permease PerM